MILKFNKTLSESDEIPDGHGFTVQTVIKTAVHQTITVYQKTVCYRGTKDETWMIRSQLYSLDQKNWVEDIIIIHRALKKMNL